jgi:quercetin dioxygenase-like cupin family protein
MKNTAALVLSVALAGGTLAAQGAKIHSPEAKAHPLFSKDLIGVPGKEVSMLTVEYPPGSQDPVHMHHAQAFVYVLEGSIVMQVKGGKPVTLLPGQTFYEGPDDVHIVGRNVSSTAPAKFLVVFVKDKGAPILTPVNSEKEPQ